MSIEINEVAGGFAVAIVTRGPGQELKSVGVKRLAEIPRNGDTVRFAQQARRIRLLVVHRMLVGLPSCTAVVCTQASATPRG